VSRTLYSAALLLLSLAGGPGDPDRSQYGVQGGYRGCRVYRFRGTRPEHSEAVIRGLYLADPFGVGAQETLKARGGRRGVQRAQVPGEDTLELRAIRPALRFAGIVENAVHLAMAIAPGAQSGGPGISPHDTTIPLPGRRRSSRPSRPEASTVALRINSLMPHGLPGAPPGIFAPWRSRHLGCDDKQEPLPVGGFRPKEAGAPAPCATPLTCDICRV